MTARKTLLLSIGLIAGVLLVASLLLFVRWRGRRPILLQGAIVVGDSDPRKELPVAGVEVTATIGSGIESARSDASGFFRIKPPEGTRRGREIALAFRHPDYHPLDLREFVGDKLYIIRMVPLSARSADGPTKTVGNVTVRYSVKTVMATNIGSAVKTFQIVNQGNVPCRNQHQCSPDGKWKAALASASLDAGAGNEFWKVRVSCIAGPCPFTRIEYERQSDDGHILSISARDWSDTATFLVEAEVLREMPTEMAHEFYPVIFGKGFSFTLPPAVEGVTIEADIEHQEIFFPLGPALFLSWAHCNVSVNSDQTKLYRCELKPGYRFR